MRSEPACLGGVSLDFARIPPRWEENLSYEHVHAGGLAQQGGIDFSLKCMHMFWNSFQIWFQTGYNKYYQISKI